MKKHILLIFGCLGQAICSVLATLANSQTVYGFTDYFDYGASVSTWVNTTATVEFGNWTYSNVDTTATTFTTQMGSAIGPGTMIVWAKVDDTIGSTIAISQMTIQAPANGTLSFSYSNTGQAGVGGAATYYTLNGTDWLPLEGAYGGEYVNISVGLSVGATFGFRAVDTIHEGDNSTLTTIQNFSYEYSAVPEPSRVSWSGYSMDSNGLIDTGYWMGWLYKPTEENWIYSYALFSWMYFQEPDEGSGGWSYIMK